MDHGQPIWQDNVRSLRAFFLQGMKNILSSTQQCELDQYQLLWLASLFVTDNLNPEFDQKICEFINQHKDELSFLHSTRVEKAHALKGVASQLNPSALNWEIEPVTFDAKDFIPVEVYRLKDSNGRVYEATLFDCNVTDMTSEKLNEIIAPFKVLYRDDPKVAVLGTNLPVHLPEETGRQRSRHVSIISLFERTGLISLHEWLQQHSECEKQSFAESVKVYAARKKTSIHILDGLHSFHQKLNKHKKLEVRNYGNFHPMNISLNQHDNTIICLDPRPLIYNNLIKKGFGNRGCLAQEREGFTKDKIFSLNYIEDMINPGDIAADIYSAGKVLMDVFPGLRNNIDIRDKFLAQLVAKCIFYERDERPSLSSIIQSLLRSTEDGIKTLFSPLNINDGVKTIIHQQALALYSKSLQQSVISEQNTIFTLDLIAEVAAYYKNYRELTKVVSCWPPLSDADIQAINKVQELIDWPKYFCNEIRNKSFNSVNISLFPMGAFNSKRFTFTDCGLDQAIGQNRIVSTLQNCQIHYSRGCSPQSVTVFLDNFSMKSLKLTSALSKIITWVPAIFRNVNAKKSALKNITISLQYVNGKIENIDFSHSHLHNVRFSTMSDSLFMDIEGFSLDNVQANQLTFENLTFKNCKFSNVKISDFTATGCNFTGIDFGDNYKPHDIQLNPEMFRNTDQLEQRFNPSRGCDFLIFLNSIQSDIVKNDFAEQMVSTVKKTIGVTGWFPNSETISALLQHFKQKCYLKKSGIIQEWCDQLINFELKPYANRILNKHEVSVHLAERLLMLTDNKEQLLPYLPLFYQLVKSQESLSTAHSDLATDIKFKLFKKFCVNLRDLFKAREYISKNLYIEEDNDNPHIVFYQKHWEHSDGWNAFYLSDDAFNNRLLA